MAAIKVEPFWDYGTIDDQFFPELEKAAEADMNADCRQRNRQRCELLDSTQTERGYSYNYRYLKKGRPGDKDDDWEAWDGAGWAYLSCEANYSVYLNAFGQLLGPYPNHELEVGSGFTAVCSYNPTPQTATEFQANLGGSQCSAEPSAMVGNPVNVAASNKFEVVTDIAPTAASALTWVRYYNSGVVYSDVGNGRPIGKTSARSGRVGSQWRTTYDRSVESTVMTTPSGFEEVARLHRQDGARIDYVKRGSGYINAADGRGRLLRDRNGWIYRSDDGDVETYDALGRLVRLEMLGGAGFSLIYSDNGTPPDVAPAPDLLIKVVDAQGRTLSVKYDLAGRVESVADGHGAAVTYSYVETDGKLLNADLSIVAYGDGTAVHYKYNEREFTESKSIPHALTGIVDENGVRFATFSYDGQGRAQNTTHALGSGSTFILSETDDKKTVRGPNGALHAYGFAKIRGSRRLVSVNQPGGAGCGAAFSSIEYDPDDPDDPDGHVSATKDFDGSLTRFVHNSDGKETERTEAAGTALARRIVTEWHADLGLPTRRARQGYEELLTYDARGNVTDRTVAGSVDPSDASSPLGVVRKWHITYNADNKPLVVEGPRSDTGAMGLLTKYTYREADSADCNASGICSYPKGDLWTTENAIGQVEEILSYDRAGRVLSRRDANGIITRYAYTARGWLASTEATDLSGVSRMTKLDYTPSGQVSRFVDPDEVTLEFRYDDAQRVVAIIDASGNRVDYELDAADQRLKEVVKDAKGTMVRQLERTFDALGRIASEKDGMGRISHFTYDELDRWTGTTDGAGNRIAATRDALGRLRDVIGDVSGVQAKVVNAYDPLDQTLSIEDPKGLKTSYLTSGLGDPAHVASPDLGDEWNEFDVAGRVAAHEAAQPKGSFTVTRDALGRTLARTYATGGERVTYTYDAPPSVCPASEQYSLGRLSQMVDSSGTTAYCYNAEGQVVRRAWTTGGGATLTLAYRYTKAGRLSGLTYPDGMAVEWVRDGAGQVSGVDVATATGSSQHLLSDVKWAPFAGPSEWTYANGRKLRREFDLAGKPLSVRDTQRGGLNYGLTYNDAAQISRIDSVTASRSYGYDGLGRLRTTHDGSSGVLLAQYDYDATGNRTAIHMHGGADRYEYAAGSHQLLMASGSRRTYDDSGNTASIGGLNLNYDSAGRLSSIDDGPNVRVKYVYNGTGERVARFESDETRLSVYDRNGRWLADYDNGGKSIVQIVWMDEFPVGMSTDGELFAVEPDHIGSPRIVVDTKRDAAVWAWPLEGEAFGSDGSDTDPDGDGVPTNLDMRFPGQRYDALSGLHYNYYRDYDPGTGRYIQSDPTGLSGGVSTYAYVGSDPLSLSDIYGLRADTDFCAGLSAKACMQIGVAYTPDYVSINVSLLGLSLGLTATGDTLYWNKAVSKSWGENVKFNTSTIGTLLKPSISADIGFLNSNVGKRCQSSEGLSARRAAVNSFVDGFGMGVGAYYGPGASVVVLPDGRTATQIGFGWGFGVTPGGESKPLFGKGASN
ncbi:hypothetical protein KPL74_18935 [Bacillus sp. NP157]|nr:hypothetical protein KPL74_18935 [Bacillus sp. NP157]